MIDDSMIIEGLPGRQIITIQICASNGDVMYTWSDVCRGVITIPLQSYLAGTYTLTIRNDSGGLLTGSFEFLTK
jgi:hypothetical protein